MNSFQTLSGNPNFFDTRLSSDFLLFGTAHNMDVSNSSFRESLLTGFGLRELAILKSKARNNRERHKENQSIKANKKS